MNKPTQKPYITVFTPSYNRAYTLRRLYESLKRQTHYNFEWLIVDDGSTDNTENLVREFIQTKNPFDIRYIKKENEGKHIAINVGAKVAQGKLFFIVDSDDALSTKAIELIEKTEAEIAEMDGFAGVAGLKGNLGGLPIKSPSEQYSQSELKKLMGSYIDATSLEYRYKYGIQGDRAEVVYTEIIRNIPFPKIEGEKFMEESYLWTSLSKLGLKFRWFNQVIYLCEYLQDGLTNNMREVVKKNWKTHCFCANFDLTAKEIPLKIRAKECARYYRYGFYGGEKVGKLWNECNDKFLSVPAILAAVVWRVK